MNQNYDIHNMRSPRYPLVNAPEAELENWIEICPESANPNPQSAIAIAGKVGLGVGKAILGSIFRKKREEELVARVLEEVYKVLWPTLDGYWNDLMLAAEELVNQAITDAVRSKALAELKGVHNTILLYKQAAEDWQNNPSDLALQERVRTQFRATNTVIAFAMPSFAVAGYEVPLLSVCTQAADLHLLLLRETVLFGREWGMSQEELDDYYSGEYGLIGLTKKYTDHCMNWYNQGLNRVSGGNAFTTTYSGVLWNKFNNFRREMTLTVLDTIATWPLYNPNLYPLGTKTELTRVLYTPSVGTGYLYGDETAGIYDGGKVKNFDLTATAELPFFSSLYSLKFAIDSNNDMNTTQIASCRQISKFTLASNTFEHGKSILGVVQTPDSGIQTVQIKQENYDVFKVFSGYATRASWSSSAHYHSFFHRLQFYRTNGNTESVIPVGGSGNIYTHNAYSEMPNNGYTDYSHRLVYVNSSGWVQRDFNSYILGGLGTDFSPTNFIFGWTHLSADPNNTLSADAITQIPAEKGYYTSITGNELLVSDITRSIKKAPGFTGGRVVNIGPNGSYMKLRVTPPANPTPTSYLVRLRYASNVDTQIYVERTLSSGDISGGTYQVAATTSGNLASLSYGAFALVETLAATFEGSTVDIKIQNMGTSPIILDKIEFIPIGEPVEEYDAKQSLKKARKAVNALFTNNQNNTLSLDVTDYDIDQAAKLVECMSDDIYPKEKMCLLDQVKCAKRLSQVRNLLNEGDFESSDGSGASGWLTSDRVYITSDNPVFKGNYLNMESAVVLEGYDKVFPTYVYQKIDESKLKPYTRYIVRGFVGNSKDLEVLVTRYDKEVDKKMNVPNDIIPTNPCTGTYRLEQCSYPIIPNNIMSQSIECDPCGNGYRSEIQNMTPPIHTKCKDPHEFEFHIDTGEIDFNINLGIGVILKIGTANGMATVDNLEVIEANPLTGEALARVKKREQKWKKEMEQKCKLTEKAVSVAKQAVDSLFTDAQKNRLQATTTMQDILNARAKVMAIPYVYHPYLEELSGMNYMISQTLQSDVYTASRLYQTRNVIRNGDFSEGLSEWHATDGANVQERDGKPHVLVISKWDANVSQEVCVQPERGYVLRVTARKEGTGNGYVTLSDCTAENTETVTFTANEPVGTPRTTAPARRTIAPAACDKTRYNESFGIVPDMNMTNYTAENTSKEVCSCGCNNTIHTPSYQAQAYSSTPSMPNVTGSSSGYITKTIEMFPETNRLRIEIGETEGTFLVESIELICMED
ncbi:insecticidal delta-endotoxin Cry8Ea1 family protein (plasmid) [Bacillus toyonensis]|uniref:Crystaline entomocidal protoxin n=1 Tax=Bacillus thuringiensis TaxID=1428 RepID=A0A7G0XPQ1_BACTU|nr:insecticidal crystal protein [Bacillus thuringiensis]